MSREMVLLMEFFDFIFAKISKISKLTVWYPDSTSWSSLPQISWLHLQPYQSQLEFQEQPRHHCWFLWLWLCRTSHRYFGCGPKRGFCHFHWYELDVFASSQSNDGRQSTTHVLYFHDDFQFWFCLIKSAAVVFL